MKIIAATATGILIEATKEELANLVGSDSSWGREYRKKRALKVGDEIPISEMFRQIATVEASHKELTGLIKTLRDYAAKLESAALPPVVTVEKD